MRERMKLTTSRARDIKGIMGLDGTKTMHIRRDQLKVLSQLQPYGHIRNIVPGGPPPQEPARSRSQHATGANLTVFTKDFYSRAPICTLIFFRLRIANDGVGDDGGVWFFYLRGRACERQ